MGDTNYKFRYLPLFYRDLEEKIDDEGSDKIMEVRRFLYNKQNQKELV